MKKHLALSLFFLFTAVSAEQVTDEQLKTSGRALANYQLCADIAKIRQDRAMLLYYSEMYQDTLLECKKLPIWQAQIIFDEQQETSHKLSKIDENNFESLCLSRFDELTRKIYEYKIEAAIKEKVTNI